MVAADGREAWKDIRSYAYTCAFCGIGHTSHLNGTATTTALPTSWPLIKTETFHQYAAAGSLFGRHFGHHTTLPRVAPPADFTCQWPRSGRALLSSGSLFQLQYPEVLHSAHLESSWYLSHPEALRFRSQVHFSDTLSSRALLGSISSGLGSSNGGPSWAPLDGGYRTTQTGATFSIKFFGQSLIWYGFYDTSFPWAAPGTRPTAFYSIDQGDTFAFSTVPSSITSQPQSSQSNLPLFQTSKLPLGQHLLEVSFFGGSGDVPLTVSNIAVSETGGDITTPSPSAVGPGGIPATVSRSPVSAVTSAAPTSAASPTGGPTVGTLPLAGTPASNTNTATVMFGGRTSLSLPSSSPSPLQASSGTTFVSPGPSGLTNTDPDSNFNSPNPASATRKSNVGAIAGGIAAGVVALLLILVLLFLRQRRRRAGTSPGAALGSSSSLFVGARRESATGAGNTAPDPFLATRQFDLGSITASRRHEESGNQSASSEKSRIYLEQQLLLSHPLSSDWPRPMNAKHGDALDATQTPTSSDSPNRSPDFMRDLSPSSSSPPTPGSQSVPQTSATIPVSMPTPPSPMSSIPRVMGTVQDEDSGIRLMQHSDTGGFVEVLPPSYTAH
ncbi:hypothetical protein D9619_013310 [Psilocybe cf. subviscida]|uniref:Uncharacterized protein n=1 Tax=Psilocybe cf. subviscida TaxID=2480587 RepID=A0A8H5BTZ5_9AGAR|nr:hypothetical protein D9619_013310 [Psilocybe cf. subviscida]